MLFAGFSAWTKNEGLMYFVIFSFVVLCWFWGTKKYKNAIYMTTLLLSLGFALFAFKMFVSCSNDLVLGALLTKSYSFAFDLTRYFMVIKSLFSTILTKFTLLLVLLLLGVKGFRIKENNKIAFRLSLMIFILCCIGYFLVYIIAPHDINWLLENSLDRIILQVLPVFLLLYGLNLRIGKPDTIK